VLRRLAALESWLAAGKLGVIRELMRQATAGMAVPRHGDLPDKWPESLDHEVALALATSVQSAQRTAQAAWELGVRLPGLAALLAQGVITYAVARLVTETFQWLSDDNVLAAEAMLIPELTGPTAKTFGQVMNLAARIAAQVDPDMAERRRKDAVKTASRVSMFREQSGAAALSGRDLPPDETLAANANVCARAALYQDSGVFAEARVDQLRATAYLDLLNEIPPEARIACGRLSTDTDVPDTESPDTPSQDSPRPAADAPDPGDPDHGHPHDGDPDGAGPAGGSPGDPGGGPAGTRPGSGGRLPRPADLVIPLATLLGLASRPGEGHGLGVLDPDLCRDLAAAAIASPRTRLCITVTDRDGIAAWHGCARRGRTGCSGDRQPRTSLVELPARLNLTITSAQLAALELAAPAADPRRHSPGTWSLTRNDTGPPGTAPPGGRDAWTLTTPDGRAHTVLLEPVPVEECDHRHQASGYHPGDRLRHLVQVRDYTCTFPPCSRHARDSDFEHARPYAKGGRTCACNAGARSRKCHRVKQSPGWNLTQPRPGWHQWTTPSGWTYTQDPHRYPV
jgi:hypothetical protein